MPEPGTNIRMCIGFQDSISRLTKKSILIGLLRPFIRLTVATKTEHTEAANVVTDWHLSARALDSVQMWQR